MALGLLVVAALIWQFYPEASPSGTLARTREEGRASPGVDREPASERGETQPLTARTRIRGKGNLLLRILGPEGNPVSGNVYWATSPQAPVTSSLMAPEHGYPLPGSGVMQQPHEGSASLPIPPGHWTWLRVTGNRGWFASRYERVAPFAGPQELAIRLTPNKRGIHVFVVQDDLTTPAGRVPVRLMAATMDAPGQVKPLASGMTDELGYHHFDDLEPGSFLLLAPGADPALQMPYTQRVLLPDQVAMTEMALTLVVPRPRVSIELDVHADLAKLPQLPPKVYLKRQGDHLGELYPMQGVLVPGDQKLAFRVPIGKYEIGVLPLGRVGIDPRQTRIEVREGGQVFSLRLTGHRPKKEIQLVGLARPDFPVTVFPRTRTPLLDDEFALMFCGPYRWHLDKQLVALPNLICDLVVTGRTGYWLSKGAVNLAGSPLEVGLQPATQLKITWKHFPKGKGIQALLHVRTSGGVFYRVMSRRFAPEGGRMDPAFVATLIVPRGPVTLECQKEGGSAYWRRTLRARDSRQEVHVDGR